MKKLGTLLFLVTLVVAAAACDAAKSSNPLSPTVAGPIPGVDISAPKTLEPTNTKIPVDQQPLTLLAENAGSTGAPALLRFRSGRRRRIQQYGVRPRGRGPRRRRPHERPAARPPRARAQLFLARARAGRRQHRPLLARRELRRLHADRHRKPGAGRSGRERRRAAAPPDVCRQQLRALRTGRQPQLSLRAVGQRFVRQQGVRDGPRAGQSNQPHRAAGSRLQHRVLLARARVRLEDIGPLVRDPRISDRGQAGRPGPALAAAAAAVAATGRTCGSTPGPRTLGLRGRGCAVPLIPSRVRSR